MRKSFTYAAATGVVTTALLFAGATTASANTDPAFQPGPDYTNFQPGPNYDAFQPGYAPGTADLVDDSVAPILTGLFGGLFR